MAKFLIGNLKPPLAKVGKEGIVKPDGETILIDEDGTLHGKQEKASDIISTDTQGILGNIGAEVSLQTIIDKVAEKVMKELMTKTMMSGTQVDDVNKVPTSALAYAMQQAITKNQNHITQLNSDVKQLDTNINNMGTSSKNAIPGVLKTFKLPSGSSSNSVKSTNFYFLPNITYEVVDPTHNTEIYFKELLKYICSKYSNEMEPDCVCFFNARPNSQGFSVLQIYNVKNVNSEGLPQYATGLFINLGGDMHIYGTSSYIYFFKTK